MGHAMYIYCKAGVLKSLKCMMRVSAEIQVYLKIFFLEQRPVLFAIRA